MQAGDHLVSQRLGYTHHGLYVGGGEVIHYAGLADPLDWSDAAVESVSLAEFKNGGGAEVQAHLDRAFAASQSVQRAQSRLGENLYNVFGNNCEHFVNWCIDGQHRSQQVERVIGVAQGVKQVVQSGAAKEVLKQGKDLVQRGLDAGGKAAAKFLGRKGGEEATKAVAAQSGAKVVSELGGKVAPALAAAGAVAETAQVWQDPDKGVAEKLYDTGTAAGGAVGSIAGGAKGASLGATIGAALGPLGAAAGGFIGGVVGSIAGSGLVRGIAKGIKGFFKGLFGGGADDYEQRHFESLQRRLQSIGGYSQQMAEELEESFGDFLRRGQNEQLKLRSPFEQDYSLLQQYAQLTPQQYAEQYATIAQNLGHYAPQLSDQVGLQLAAALESLQGAAKIKGKRERQEQVEQARAELRKSANWHVHSLRQAIMAQLAQAEEDFIGRHKRAYLQQLDTKLTEYEQARDTIETLFGRQHGLLYDRSQGMLNRHGFELLEHFRQLAADPAIKELIEELGRMRAAEQEYEKAQIESVELRQAERVVPYFREELVGVTIGSELAHVLPSEYALLSGSSDATSLKPGQDPAAAREDAERGELLELLFYKKFCEKQLNIYEFTSLETDYASHKTLEEIERAKPSKKGPFILCVDTSGSMAGLPERVAKTLAFIILRTALEENRKCLLLNFGDTVETMELTEISRSLPRLLEFLQMSFHAGNSVDPVAAALPLLAKPGFAKADVLVVSDFQLGDSSPDTVQKMRAAQAEGTKFHSVVIGAGTEQNKLFDSEWIYNGSWTGLHSAFHKTRA